MAKAKRKSPKPAPPPQGASQPSRSQLLDKLNHPNSAYSFFGLLFLFLIFLYKPVVIDGLGVEGSDVISGIGNTHQMKVYEEQTGHKPLWNPYMFAGTPVYHRHNAVSWSLDSLIWLLDRLLDWRVWYLWLGALGMFLLIRYLGLHALAAMMAALGYILLPHFHALIVVGHFAKLRALMWVPFVLLTFLRLIDRRDLLSMFLFTTAFALLMRTQHYQIIFYTLLLMLFSGLPQVRATLCRQWSKLLKLGGLLAAAVVLVVLIVTQPLFVTRDYAPYSTRGGNAVDLSETVADQDKKGVGFEYATNWSYTVPEFWNLIIPKFHGGTSQETYTGSAVPQFRNQTIPTYWGDLPFTQSLEYLSVLLAFLALVAIFFQWERPLVKGLTVLTVLALLLSLGRHFEELYKLFFYYLPYFDKFRVPMMILTLVAFNVCVLAAIGLDHLIRGNITEKSQQTRLYVLGGAYLVILAIPLLMGSSFALSPENEVQRYAGQYGMQQAQQLVNLLKQARLEILQGSAIRSLAFFVALGLLVLLAVRKVGYRDQLLLGMVVLVALDLGLVSSQYLQGKFVDLDSMEKQAYHLTAVDQQIFQDAEAQGDSLYRVLPPIRRVASDSRWQYFHQSIGGYSAAKLQVIQDIISNNLVDPSNPRLPLNLKVVGMLNGKYIASNQRYSGNGLTYLGSDEAAGLHAFRNEAALPRAFFVGRTRVIADGVERLKYMNSAEFDPGGEALLEVPLEADIAVPDSNSYARVTHFAPDQLTVEVSTNVQTLLVLSEVYYPRWKAALEDGAPLKIYKTNHLLRSMAVPAGQHTITLTFHPGLYYTGVTISWIGWLITYAGLGFFFWQGYLRKQDEAA